MSILIKGMEMPNRCEECPFCIALGLKSPPLCSVTGYRVLGHGKARLDNCPLVLVPEHDRLIEYHAAVHAVYDGYKQFGLPWRNAEVMLGKLPTIIPAEEGKT